MMPWGGPVLQRRNWQSETGRLEVLLRVVAEFKPEAETAASQTRVISTLVSSTVKCKVLHNHKVKYRAHNRIEKDKWVNMVST